MICNTEIYGPIIFEKLKPWNILLRRSIQGKDKSIFSGIMVFKRIAELIILKRNAIRANIPVCYDYYLWLFMGRKYELFQNLLCFRAHNIFLGKDSRSENNIDLCAHCLIISHWCCWTFIASSNSFLVYRSGLLHICCFFLHTSLHRYNIYFYSEILGCSTTISLKTHTRK